MNNEDELLARIVVGSQRSSENTSNQHTANYDFLKLSYAEGTGVSASRGSRAMERSDDGTD